MFCSYIDQLPFLIFGLRILTHLSQHCFPHLPLMFLEHSVHHSGPLSHTQAIRRSSSDYIQFPFFHSFSSVKLVELITYYSKTFDSLEFVRFSLDKSKEFWGVFSTLFFKRLFYLFKNVFLSYFGGIREDISYSTYIIN